MSRKRMILGIACGALFLLFILLNLESATINFFWIIHTQMPVAVAVLFSFLLGAGTALLFLWFKGKKKPPA